jgi:lysophospholipase L1-like esterase
MKRLPPAAIAMFFAATFSAYAQEPGPPPKPAKLPHNFAKWEKDIAAFEAADKADPPPKGAVLFIGSSGIRLWKTLQQDFPQVKTINRGFGGSEIADSTHFASRIIFPYEPKKIFLRAGGNDIHAGRPPGEVAADFREFVRVVHSRLPKTEIYYIAFNPAPARWGETDKLRALNKRIRKMAIELPRVAYVDAFDVSLMPDGKTARDAVFVPDLVHFNAAGYTALAERVRPFLAVPK